MLEYPSIDKQIRNGIHLYVFDKLDGNLIRATWVRKKGFTKFGRKEGLLDDSHPFLSEAPALFQTKYGEILGRIFHDARWTTATAFAEFHGPNSFAGWHVQEPHTVTLFDVSPEKQGILPPKEYLKLMRDQVEIAPLLYTGLVNQELAEDVRESRLEGMTFEGVVCKGAPQHKEDLPVLFKIKSRAWLEKLKAYCKGDEALFERLS